VRKKGGGIFHRPVMSSSAGMFARKGDPWVTGREGERDYNRQVEVENPDMDADRQRHERISRFSKEFQDRVHKPIDAKMTMREAIETERSVRLDGYQAEKAFRPKPKAGKWPERGKDFQVATVQRRLVGVAIRTRREVNALEGKNTTNIISGGKMSSTPARVNTTARIGCPRGCGLVVTDSRLISKHLQKFKNSCCTHGHCNCEDCKRARND
jgi:hypothetical protein